MIKVAVIDDHAVVRMGLRYVLEMDGEFQFVGDLADGNDAVRFVREKKPDVLLLDIYMPGKNGISVLEDVLIAFPDQKVVMLTTSSADNDAYTALELGAKGYLLKDRDAKDLPKAIREVANGGSYVPEEVRDLVRQRQMTPSPTMREQAVLEGLVAGKGNEQIASEMGISKNCVKIHVKHLFAKLGVEDRVSAVTSAIKRGFVRISFAFAVALSVSTACAAEGEPAEPVASLARVIDMAGATTGRVEVARVLGLVSHVSAINPRTFVLTLTDRRYKGGVPVVLHGGAPMPETGDEINVGGYAEYIGDSVTIHANGFGKVGRSAPLYQEDVKNIDLRKGFLRYRTIAFRGQAERISGETRNGMEISVLCVKRENMSIYVHVPGRLSKSRYIGRPVSVQGCVMPVFDESGTSHADIVEVATVDGVDVLDTRWGMVAVWTAGSLLSVSFLAIFVAWVRSRRRQLELSAVAAERKRMAADLHDTIEQHLACVKLLLCGALNNDTLPERTVKTISRACEVLANAKMEVRDAVLNLRSDEALTKSPAEALREMADGIAKSGDLKVRVKLDGLPGRLRQGRFQDMLLIVREAITNAIKHGKAKTIALTSDPIEGGALLRVFNDGERFDAEKALGPETGHYGLAGMRERAARSGFTLKFVKPDKWCGIELLIPSEDNS